MLMKNAEALERLERLEQLEQFTVLVVDKTGTLTESKPWLSDVLHTTGVDTDKLLAL